MLRASIAVNYNQFACRNRRTAVSHCTRRARSAKNGKMIVNICHRNLHIDRIAYRIAATRRSDG